MSGEPGTGELQDSAVVLGTVSQDTSNKPLQWFWCEDECLPAVGSRAGRVNWVSELLVLVLLHKQNYLSNNRASVTTNRY